MSGVTINFHINGSSVAAAPIEPREPEALPVVAETAAPFAVPEGAFEGLLSGDEITIADDDETDSERAAWMAKRSGKITCSRFGDLMASGRKKDDVFSAAGYAYLRLKIAERLGSYHTVSAASMAWGNDNEAEAIQRYSSRQDVSVESAPFTFFELNEDIGGTPDGLIGNDGCLEVKCPFNPAVHINTLLTNTIPSDYQWQVIGHLLVTGRKWCDFVSFDPRIIGPKKLFVKRYERDEKEIETLLTRLTLGVEWIKETMAKM